MLENFTFPVYLQPNGSQILLSRKFGNFRFTNFCQVFQSGRFASKYKIEDERFLAKLSQLISSLITVGFRIIIPSCNLALLRYIVRNKITYH